MPNSKPPRPKRKLTNKFEATAKASEIDQTNTQSTLNNPDIVQRKETRA